MKIIPYTTPPRWPADLATTRFASMFRRDSPEGCRVALLGLADDTGIQLNRGRPGAAVGPAAFRSALTRYGVAHPSGAPWPRVFDAGDVAPADTLEETHVRVTAATGALLELGLLPVAIGGGHDLTFPFVRAVAQEYGPLTGVYFDAHLDVRENPGSGMAFRRLLEAGHARGLHLHGYNPHVNSREHYGWFVAHGGKVYPEFAEPALPREGGYLFVSFDLDVLDMSCAPGVSAPNPAGLMPREATRWVTACGADLRVRCFDLMELSPPHDEGGRTARLAAHLFLSFLAGVSARPKP
jgi:formiminoglutamase